MKVLTIDGGGIRGLIPALVLAEIERRCDRPAGELFDLVAGTSTGAIIACALTRPRAAGGRADRADLRRRGAGDLRPLADQAHHLGRRSDSTSATTPTACSRRCGGTWATHAAGRREAGDPAHRLRPRAAAARASCATTDDMSMVDAAHASSAAPSYFEPARVGELTLVDGGVFATNPAMCAYADVDGDVELLVSLGCGEHTRALPYEQVQGLGPARVDPAGARRRLRRHRRRGRHPAQAR